MMKMKIIVVVIIVVVAAVVVVVVAAAVVVVVVIIIIIISSLILQTWTNVLAVTCVTHRLTAPTLLAAMTVPATAASQATASPAQVNW